MNSTIKPKPCSNCGSVYHSAMYHKPRKPIEITAVLKRKAIKKQKTRLAMEWDFTRRTWLENNASPYSCHYCSVKLYKTTVTLDHRIPRSRAPELRNDIANLVPCCFTCNGLKGSVDHDSYNHDCPDNVKETV